MEEVRKNGKYNIMEIVDVINAISDIKSLDMFCSIAKESVDVEVLKHKKGLSKKTVLFKSQPAIESRTDQEKKRLFLTYSVWCSCISCSTHY
jgi:hypothetical protein